MANFFMHWKERFYHRLRGPLIEELKVWKHEPYPPGHYHSTIPATADLGKTAIIDYSQAIEGVDLKVEEQIKLLELLKKNYREDEFPTLKKRSRRYFFQNDYFSYSDGIFLYLMMRHFKPLRIIEVGSGFSSALMLDVNEGWFKNSIDLLFIEPYPKDRLITLIDKNDKFSLIDDFVQRVDLSFFQNLDENDILFIDSSHVLKYNSDVNFILFEVLPILKPGVIIHFHDVFFPFEYPPEWFQQGRAWNEQYALRAFLQYNTAFEIVMFTSYMEGFHREWFERNMPLCLRQHETILLEGREKLMATNGQSLYIRKK